MKLICYLSNGYPTLEDSAKMAETYVENGSDTIEIDFPSRDPYLESELISGRMAKALENCDDYDRYMEEMAEVKKRLPSTGFILMTYENTVEEIGVEKFISFCLENDYRDIILVGLKGDEIKNRIIESGLRVSCYVQFHLPEDEVEHALASNGFTYLQAVASPGQTTEEHPTLKSCIDYLRGRGLKNPIYCGVGVHTPAEAALVKAAGADGVFVGSAILRLQDDPEAFAAKLAEFKTEC